jgi:hypothetical protein
MKATSELIFIALNCLDTSLETSLSHTGALPKCHSPVRVQISPWFARHCIIPFLHFQRVSEPYALSRVTCFLFILPLLTFYASPGRQLSDTMLQQSGIICWLSVSSYRKLHHRTVKVKVKVKSLWFLHWAPRHEGMLREWRYNSTHSLTYGGEWSPSRPGRFTPGERAPGTHWIGGWASPRAVLDAVVKRNIPSPRWESNP